MDFNDRNGLRGTEIMFLDLEVMFYGCFVLEFPVIFSVHA